MEPIELYIYDAVLVYNVYSWYVYGLTHRKRHTCSYNVFIECQLFIYSRWDLKNSVGVILPRQWVWWHRYSIFDVKYSGCGVIKMVAWCHKTRMLCLVMSVGHVHPSSWGRRICWPGHCLRDLSPEWPAVLHDSWHCPRGRQQPGNLGGPGIFAAEKAKEATSAVRLCPEASVLTSVLLRGTSSYHLVHFFSD